MRLSEATEKPDARLDATTRDAAASAHQNAEGIAQFTDAVVQDSKDGASRLAKLVQKSSDGAIKAFRDNVKAQPSLMIVLAGGAGIILCLLLAGRR